MVNISLINYHDIDYIIHENIGIDIVLSIEYSRKDYELIRNYEYSRKDYELHWIITNYYR